MAESARGAGRDASADPDAAPAGGGPDMARAEVVTSRPVFEGRVFSVRVDEVRLSDGRISTRDVIEHPGAVVIAAVDDGGRVALVRQYRHAVGGELLELPAGTLEPGEPPAETAVRELREETGLAAARWVLLGSFYSSPGFLHEELHAYLATGLTVGTQAFDDDEDIAVEWLPLARLLDDPGRVRDAKTLATLLLVFRHLAGAEGTETGVRPAAPAHEPTARPDELTACPDEGGAG